MTSIAACAHPESASAQKTSASRPALSARVLRAAQLTPLLRERMYAVYAAHYDASPRARFDADLAAKHFVILLERADDGVLAGFSTVAHERANTGQGPVQVLFSGDTVIERAAWGDQALARTFARLAGALAAQDRATPLYWLLISKGHRTYRYLGLFARRYVPHPQGDDVALRALADELAAARFGADYRPASGTIVFPESHGHLREAVADVAPHLAARPDVALFLRRNPGWRRGDELLCLAPIEAGNLRSLVRAEFLHGLRGGLPELGLAGAPETAA
ncbi:hypothetical protein [Ottowia testudinis]|uniref:Uncharacterized protein n=1 Tax=Ottowia testudinis TaxID=2816950 RepID=A0A975CLN8_9BURK|nr:hypothetical protein [Ottowia testudinis]QTD45778.1 hypothetical protein J1M35_02330 [Ottowia testudinis]